ncbi:putative stress-induced protein OsmC [Mucinivorans hirudinis]|uniref:Putative stress-induced protein OsmC n=1 Tax=Mucinivorans hirudinis TaxID=1433126 RepID=A0A060REN8_9BACT|nr:putative stress-induced protein OsmC [Mucinivorans hirudinis]
MATIKTVYLGELRTQAEHLQSGTKIITDAPTDNQGKGEAFSPTDLLATSLGSCMLTIMGIAARTHGFDIDGTRVTTTKVMGTNPRRVVEVILEMQFPNNYEDKHKRIIEAAAKECPVANSLHPDLKQTVTFIYGK